jgi:hypothetical protein
MKGEIIIEHSKTKRILRLPFNICGDKETLIAIRNALSEALDDDFVYGWIEVRREEQKPIPNQEPIEWDK